MKRPAPLFFIFMAALLVSACSSGSSSSSVSSGGGSAPIQEQISETINSVNERIDDFISQLPIPEPTREIFKITILGLPWLLLILLLIMLGGLGNRR